jgi:glycosyltransferase involved in cell wall biosynthesis
MRIALNLLYLLPGVVGGTETYARSLIKALARQGDDNEYSIFLNRESAELDVTPAENFTRVVCPINATNRAARYSWEQGAMPLQLRRSRPDIVHSLGYVIPLAARGPQVVTVHDVNYLGHKGWRTGVGRTAFRFFAERTVKRADRIIAVSRFSRDEIVTHGRKGCESRQEKRNRIERCGEKHSSPVRDGVQRTECAQEHSATDCCVRKNFVCGTARSRAGWSHAGEIRGPRGNRGRRRYRSSSFHRLHP